MKQDTLTVNQSIPKYWTKKNEVKLLMVVEYQTKKMKKVRHTAPTVIVPSRMKIGHLNQLTKIIALYGSQK